MRFFTLLLTVTFFVPLVSCDPYDSVPFLPADIDRTRCDARADLFDVDDGTPDSDRYSTEYDDSDDITAKDETLFIVAQVKAYDEPAAGSLSLLRPGESPILTPFVPDEQFGDANGSDLNLSVQGDRIHVIERYGTDRVSCFTVDGTYCGYRTFKSPYDTLMNFHDAVYVSQTGETVITAHQHNALFVVKDDGSYREIDLRYYFNDSPDNLSPDRLFLHENMLLVTLQVLGTSWESDAGYLLVLDVNDLTEGRMVKLPAANPFGGIRYNAAVDPDHVYVACAGNWRDHDGGIVRISLDDFTADTVLAESGKAGDPLYGDMVDLAVTNRGIVYIIVSSFDASLSNALVRWNPVDGIIRRCDDSVNAFAVNPLLYDSEKSLLVYFKDVDGETYVTVRDTGDGTVWHRGLKYAPASLSLIYTLYETADGAEQ